MIILSSGIRRCSVWLHESEYPLVVTMVDWIHVNHCKCALGFPLTWFFSSFVLNETCCAVRCAASFVSVTIMTLWDEVSLKHPAYCTLFCLCNYSKDTQTTHCLVCYIALFSRSAFFFNTLIKNYFERLVFFIRIMFLIALFHISDNSVLV